MRKRIEFFVVSIAFILFGVSMYQRAREGDWAQIGENLFLLGGVSFIMFEFILQHRRMRRRSAQRQVEILKKELR